MRKSIFYLLCSVLGNALGTALMANTNLGLTAWGSAAQNVAGFFDITFGTAFIILALIFYVIALMIRKKIEIINALLSLAVLLAFGLLSDLFINLIPDMTGLSLVMRIFINFVGLSILLFSIALHLKILIAVHPCDVFLYEMRGDNLIARKYVGSCTSGTYLNLIPLKVI
ncbi:MAG: DUF6198 family protein [Acholeplasmataceae bacterium]|nr:DUF6198 family protein [Acholeplasmataceae bacterium]